jgi:hypothetical protein
MKNKQRIADLEARVAKLEERLKAFGPLCPRGHHRAIASVSGGVICDECGQLIDSKGEAMRCRCCGKPRTYTILAHGSVFQRCRCAGGGR